MVAGDGILAQRPLVAPRSQRWRVANGERRWKSRRARQETRPGSYLYSTGTESEHLKGSCFIHCTRYSAAAQTQGAAPTYAVRLPSHAHARLSPWSESLSPSPHFSSFLPCPLVQVRATTQHTHAALAKTYFFLLLSPAALFSPLCADSPPRQVEYTVRYLPSPCTKCARVRAASKLWPALCLF